MVHDKDVIIKKGKKGRIERKKNRRKRRNNTGGVVG